MAALVSATAHPAQHRGGILLNATAYPRSSPLFLPTSPIAQKHKSLTVSVHSSSASSTSSTDEVSSSDGINGSTSARKIRFAPLPDPHRAVLIDEDGQDLPLPELPQSDEWGESPINVTSPMSINSARSFPNSFPAACSTDTFGSSYDNLDSGISTETSTVIGVGDGGSECGSVRSASSRKRGSGGSFKGFLKPFARLSKSTPSPEEVLTLGTINLFRSSSRESTASSTYSYKEPSFHRRLSGSSFVDDRKTGLPLSQVSSERGTAATLAQKPINTPHGRRMLNGRVYGSKRAERLAKHNANPFGDVRNEPEFVEWGYGGMGSVKHGAAAGSMDYSKVQGGQALGGGEEEEDGSGMLWVKRRREERERLKREKEEKEAKEKQGVGGKGTEEKDTSEARPVVQTPSIEIRAATPDGKTPNFDGLSTNTMVRAQEEPEDHGVHGTPKSEEPAEEKIPEVESVALHVPAPRPGAHSHTAHAGSSQHDVANPLPPSSSASSSSVEDDEEENEEEEEDGSDSDDGDDEDDEDEEESRRLTVLSAGIEKIARHKHD